MALIVTLKQESAEKTSILLQVHSLNQEMYLPDNLQMTVRSAGEEFRGPAIAHHTSHVIQLELTVELGEEFAVELISGDLTVTENFLM